MRFLELYFRAALKSQNGYTIFELIVVISIVVLLTFVGLTTVDYNKKNVRFDEAVTQLVGDIQNLKTASQFSLSAPISDSSPSCGGANPPCATWRLYPNVEGQNDLENYLIITVGHPTLDLNAHEYEVFYRGASGRNIKPPTDMEPMVIVNRDRDGTQCSKSYFSSATLDAFGLPSNPCSSPNDETIITFHPPGIEQGSLYPLGFANLDYEASDPDDTINPGPEQIDIYYEYKSEWRKLTIDRILNIQVEKL
ncbi:MAG: hypothetical protein COT81_03790 [Candidatus Buchananbacteria bacterium CG10_big_fil_rev_8_21_14_0_10_42_9]|uniref:Uncharacterized protein n=1 Tax=Candidatus Buchananbacteria bacterium CG10_big_fil_rev_8_21_14_0_10_42_9 TaxID=1974526 RepID=A0A2H0W0U8_9BACT|nr:MAG: hypothetical protein COT81_03790 [Candidatus Buchananbacteria bacterium CG10_big_fil_rev_8_21_14_0_10_42_9]